MPFTFFPLRRYLGPRHSQREPLEGKYRQEEDSVVPRCHIKYSSKLPPVELAFRKLPYSLSFSWGLDSFSHSLSPLLPAKGETNFKGAPYKGGAQQRTPFCKPTPGWSFCPFIYLRSGPLHVQKSLHRSTVWMCSSLDGKKELIIKNNKKIIIQKKNSRSKKNSTNKKTRNKKELVIEKQF